MPHSSGGGSHGGGHHGGSHRSGGGSARKIRTQYFSGARTYVRYRNNKPEYIYSNSDLLKPRSKARFFILLFYLPFIVGIILAASQTMFPPKKIEDKCIFKPQVIDNIGVIDDDAALLKRLNAFYEKTGIGVRILTVYDSEWKGKYKNLEKFAYAEYVKRFVKDENHWLIVYSQPEINSGNFINWSWEGMQGDNTDRIITTNLANTFTKDLQKYLLADTTFTVGQAFCQIFDDITPTVMDGQFQWIMVFTYLIAIAFVGLHMYFMVFYDPNKKYKGVVYCGTDTNYREATCNYCKGIYVIGTCISCPHCGAPLEHINI